MSAHKFLDLLRAVEAGRRVSGQPSMEVTNEHVSGASEIERSQASHDSADNCPKLTGVACPTCEEIRQKEIALRELMHAQGVDFPVGLLEGQPAP